MTHRTQLYLDEPRYQFLVQWAQRKRATIAQAVRDLIDERMKAGSSDKTKRDPLWKIVGIGSGDGSRVAENYEEHLYGK